MLVPCLKGRGKVSGDVAVTWFGYVSLAWAIGRLFPFF